jgi:DNA mismatch repair protein MutS
MISQYLTIKEQYPDAILFYRMGDFYEMFFEDAEKASRILEITLTSRNKKDLNPVPMCGVPYRAAQGYIARLIENGCKVAICDQVEDPASAKGLVKRDVVRVVTPGMIVENELLDAKSNNYILAVTKNGNLAGLSYLDISTGTFRVVESIDFTAIIDETLRISPREVLLPDLSDDDPFFSTLRSAISDKHVTFLSESVFSFKRGREQLIEMFKTFSLEGFGCEHLRVGIRAAGALIHYITETQKQKIEHIAGIESYLLESYLQVDDLSCRNLELVRNIRTGSKEGTLLGVIDHTVTAMGGRLLRRWIRYPLIDMEEIRFRQDAVHEAKENIQKRRQVRENFGSVYDLERLGSRISMGHANARDLLALRRSLSILPEVIVELSEFNCPFFRLEENVEALSRLADLMERSIREDTPLTVNEGGMIKTGYSEALDELIEISRDGRGFLAKLEAKEKKATGISTLKVRFNKVFGYYIEIPKARSESVPIHYVRKQTLVNAERYITDELKAFESKVLGAEEKRAKLEYDLFNGIRLEVIGLNSSIQAVARYLARIDCILTLAHVADLNDFNRPEINRDGIIKIEDGRHPVVEKITTGERFVPNSVGMDNIENQILIITGPNMAGKSTVLRQVAIIVLLAQMGSFVPARSASISITDRIFTRVGALDNLSQGQSTFMVEMQETANILNSATAKSLVIMDEIGRGTSTFDGLSIAWAVAEYLHDLKGAGVKTLFATHYHELTELADSRQRVKNLNIAVKEWNDEIIFLRKLVKGGTNRSYGIQVARLAGIPADVIKRSKKILYDIENRESGTKGKRVMDTVKGEPVKGHLQLNLFRQPGEIIFDTLLDLDISRMTPLEAMNCLSELQEKIKGIG